LLQLRERFPAVTITGVAENVERTRAVFHPIRAERWRGERECSDPWKSPAKHTSMIKN
jgi:hypothetical protein